MRTCSAAIFGAILTAMFTLGCVGAMNADGTSLGSASQREFPLGELSTATVRLGDTPIPVWLADTNAKRTEGLMWVTSDELGTDRGMLFVFETEQLLSFWMRNTIISLDIAFVRADGTIVKIHTMPPLTLQGFPSIEPALFALEVAAGTFERLGVREGDRLVVPTSIFKP